MKNKYPVFKLSDITELITDGKHGDCQDEESSGYFFLSSKDLYDGKLHYDNPRQIKYDDFLETHRRTNLKPGDILLANCGASIGRVGIAQIDDRIYKTTFQKSISVIKADKRFIDNKYLYYFFRGNSTYLVDLGSGTAQPNLLISDLRRITINLPPLPIQKKIAAILSAYDDLIEKNNLRIAILEKMAEEIYREWFIRLRFPGHELVKFNKGIPEGWEVVKLNDMSEITSSKRIYAHDYVQDGVPFYRSKEIIQKYNNTEISELLYISTEKFNDIKRTFGAPQKNDILITSVGTLGVCYLVKENDYFYFKDGNLIWFRKYNDLINKYLYYWLQTEHGKNSLLETTIGTSQPAFTIVNLKKINILKPTDNILTRFISIIDPINIQKEKLLTSVTNLKQTRDRLLTRLISGKLSVEDLDIQFPPSMREELE